MDFGDIMKGVFPMQSMGSKAASEGFLGLGGMLGGGMDNQQMLLGLLAPQLLGGMGGGQEEADPYAELRPEQFLTQTPGAPGQQNRGSMPQGGGQQQQDPLAMLDANIMRRFGGQ